MNETKCIICGSKNIEKFPAKFSEFISRRVFDGENKNISIIRCLECGFSFYSYRFNQSENKKLYLNYRDEEYQMLREQFEPDYTKEKNYLLKSDEIEFGSREANMLRILNTHLSSINEIKTVLDFGGDKGQLIYKAFPAAKKYVYEISNPDVFEEITLINDLDKIKNMKFDLVICAQVLEHVSNPIDIIKLIKNYLMPDGYFYIEVPYYTPFNKSSERIDTKEYLMHEHINFYTIKSLEMLMKSCGEILYSGVEDIKTTLGNTKVISALIAHCDRDYSKISILK